MAMSAADKAVMEQARPFIVGVLAWTLVLREGMAMTLAGEALSPNFDECIGLAQQFVRTWEEQCLK